MKFFNTEGSCIPEENYMVDLTSRVKKIEQEVIARGKYFTISRARQYGKTTFLYLLERTLSEKYIVLSISFESSEEYFVSQAHLAKGLRLDIGELLEDQSFSEEIIRDWKRPFETEFPMKELGGRITKLCDSSDRGIVLLIDEVDKCSENQVFLSFLGLLRSKYLERKKRKGNTFQSVILAGVYDIKNLKLKLLPDDPIRYNSPWNISANITLDMSFSAEEISKMLSEYETDHHTGMETEEVGQALYDYTSGYPYLVSALCQIMDEQMPDTLESDNRLSVWTRQGVAEAEHRLRKSVPVPALFDDITKNLQSYPKLKKMISEILFSGARYPFNMGVEEIQLGVQFGFLKEKNSTVAVSNRIFETVMYDTFIAEMAINSENSGMYWASMKIYNRFVINGQLQMDLVMRSFYDHFQEIYAGSDERFLEEQGRKLFLLYLKPIINGSGNYYVEARTRDMKRTDVIVDYHGTQHVIELKIYHGNEYNKRGEAQLFEYLAYYKKDVGYLLSFNFNKKKKTGIQEVNYQGKRILEVVV
ncbi:MAG: AAA-like domain-containing protein [Lachnospiraceae bacterium]|nr:AAA-like domain-containing protein [Lachnospiraceae bacterium]MCD7956731.1 AAA-like domain-containing protein [Lachnospiraceae bacterium]